MFSDEIKISYLFPESRNILVITVAYCCFRGALILILQPFRCFSYVIGTTSTSQLILQPFHRFIYVTTHSEGRRNLILQPLHLFTYFTAHSPTLPPLYLHHSSFYNPSVASPTSQLILQPFRCFTYIISTSLNSPGEPPMILSCRSLL